MQSLNSDRLSNIQEPNRDEEVFLGNVKKSTGGDKISIPGYERLDSLTKEQIQARIKELETKLNKNL